MFHKKPTHFFVCQAASEGYTPLNAFDNSLMKAGVGNTNLIRLSSILPPGVTETETVPLEPGCFLPIAYASITSTTPQEIISAGVAVAVPADPGKNGVIMEYSARGHAEDIERIVRAMAEEAMKMRDFDIKEIISAVSEHEVETTGVAFAGVVLYA